MSTLYNRNHMGEPRHVFEEGITLGEYNRIAEGVLQPFADVPVHTPRADAEVHYSALDATHAGGLSRVPLASGTLRVEFVEKGF